MDIDSDDDALYGPAEPSSNDKKARNAEVKMEDAEDGEEEGEEVEDDDDSDVGSDWIQDLRGNADRPAGRSQLHHRHTTRAAEK